MSTLASAIAAGKARARDGEGFLYVAEWRHDQQIKIGHAINLERRLKELGCNGQHVRLLGYFPAAISVERAFHKRFRSHRINGECYSRDWLLERAA